MKGKLNFRKSGLILGGRALVAVFAFGLMMPGLALGASAKRIPVSRVPQKKILEREFSTAVFSPENGRSSAAPQIRSQPIWKICRKEEGRASAPMPAGIAATRWGMGEKP